MPRLALFAVLLACPLARAAEPAPGGPPAVEVARRYDLTYATVGGEALKLDLAAPKTGGPYPCVVCLHGGAWRLGSRKDLSVPPGDWADYGTRGQSLIEMLASRGFAAASVSYRLAPRHKFPAQIQDAKTAVRFLRANAKDLNIDPDRIAALGFSAGGHLAALLGTTGPDAGFDGDLYPGQSSRVSCVVDYFGPADLTLYCETPGLERAFFAPLFGGPAAANLDRYRQASPVNHVGKGTVPFLIVHGTADLIVPILHSERLYDKLVAAGVPAELVPVRGKGHGWFGPAFAETTEAAVRFLTAQLKGK